MGLTVKRNTAIAVVEESTEGTYAPPASSADFVQTLSDGTELSPSKELLERNIFNSSIGKVSPRTGRFTASGTLPVECRAFSTEGGAPEFNSLMKSALGSRRQSTTTITTKSSGNTGSVLQIQDSDIGALNVGDIVMVKEAGAFHVSPIQSKTSATGTASITLLIPKPSGSFSNSVQIAKFTTYTVADSGHPSLSISKYLEGAVLEQAVGCRVNSMSLDNFSTGQIPSFKFGFEGLGYSRSLTPIPYAPSYDTALPPIVLDARVYMDTSQIEVNDLSISLSNSLGFREAVSAPNGRISGRAVERSITGSFNPYKLDNDISNFTKYNANTAFKLFAYAKIPSAVAGEFSGVVAVYMPNCIITDLKEADKDQLLQDAISFSANRGAGTTPEIYISFI